MQDERDLVRAVERAENTGTTAQLANSLDHLAAYYHENGRYTEAAPIYARGLGMWRQILGPEHPSVATLSINLAQIYLHLGRVDEAGPLFRQAIGIFEADVEFEDEGVMASFDLYVRSLRSLGRTDEAALFEERVRRVAAQVSETVNV